MPRTSQGDRQQQPMVQRPYVVAPTILPTHPAPCARPSSSRSPRSLTPASASPVIPYQHPEWLAGPPSTSPHRPSRSADHTRRSSRQGSTTLHHEKLSERSTSDSESSDLYGRDVEKGSFGSHRSSNSNIMTSITYDEEEEPVDEYRQQQEQKATGILLFMSGPCVLLSCFNCIWTIIALFLTVLTQPFRLGANKPTFGQHLSGLLGPALDRQLRCIYSPTPTQQGPFYAPISLVGVHLLSPFLSFAMMFASWTLAIYWLSSAIVGDPAGQDKRDDGKETVLGLRNCWERWLMKSFKS